MLKYEIEQVPEELQTFYVKDEKTGKFRLNAEGVVSASEFENVKSKLSEFRSSNITLKKQLEELSDFEAVVGTDKTVTKDGVKNTIESLVQNRVQQMKSQFDTTLMEKEKKLASAHNRLSEVLISDAVKAAAIGHGVVPTAVDDVIARAKSQFKVDEDYRVISASSEGDADGNPLVIETFVSQLKERAPHLFARSEGTGSPFPRNRATTTAQPEQSRASRLAAFAKK
jgi:hypothetical protein